MASCLEVETDKESSVGSRDTFYTPSSRTVHRVMQGFVWVYSTF